MRQEEHTQSNPPTIQPQTKRVWVEPAIVLERSLAASAQSWPPNMEPRFGQPQLGPYGVFGVSGIPEW